MLPFWATFEQNIGLEHISSTKKVNDFIQNVNFLNFIFIVVILIFVFKIFSSWPMLVIIVNNEE